MLALEQANYKVLLNDQKIGQGAAAYSYVFGVSSDADGFGGSGNLDHAVALYDQLIRHDKFVSKIIINLQNT